ncbi:MAG: hypothetical protein NVS3B20_04980 [Polyangiales bacterium]
MASSLDPAINNLLESIDLVTFDTFGTLIDWRQALPALSVGLDRMQVFLKESERRQRPNRRDFPFIAYRQLLQQVGEALRPDLGADELARWARRFGELPFFPEVQSGIALLGAVVDVGVVSNCDAVHQFDVMRRLGRAFDVTIVSEEMGAYKPTDRAWDRATAMVEERGYDRARWLHVSAWNDYDLAPAAARGVRTAFVPRTGGVPPRPGAVDVSFDDVLALARAVAEAKGGPLAYEVEAQASSKDVMHRYVQWMCNEHLASVRACSGVRRAELLQVGELVARSVYRFTGRASFQRYLERDAPRLRARGAELFPESELQFTHSNVVVLHAL